MEEKSAHDVHHEIFLRWIVSMGALTGSRISSKILMATNSLPVSSTGDDACRRAFESQAEAVLY